MVNAVTVLVLVLVPLATLVTGPPVYFNLFRSGEFPWKQRMATNMLLILALQSMLVVSYLGQALSLLEGSLVTRYSDIVCLPGCLGVYGLRSFTLALRNKLEDEKERMQKDRIMRKSVWLKLCHFEQKYARIVTLMLGFVYHLIFVFSLIFSFQYEDYVVRGMQYWAPPTVLGLFFVICVACMLNGCKADGLHLKKELKFVSAIAFSGIVVGNVLNYTVGFIAACIVWVITLWACTFTTFIVPYKLYRLNQKQQQQKWAGLKGLHTLEELISWNAGADAFLRFLQTDFSSENLYFWQAATLRDDYLQYLDALRLSNVKCCPWSPILKWINTIYDDHVCVMSVHKVNLPGYMRTKLVLDVRAFRVALKAHEDEHQVVSSTTLTTSNSDCSCFSRNMSPEAFQTMLDTIKTHLDMFIESRQEIYKLMESDSFPRFCRSAIVEELLKQINAANVQVASSGLLGQAADNAKLRCMAATKSQASSQRKYQRKTQRSFQAKLDIGDITSIPGVMV